MYILGSILSSWAIGITLLGLFCLTPGLKQSLNSGGLLDVLVANFLRNFSIFCVVTYSLARIKISFTSIVALELVMLLLVYAKLLLRSNTRLMRDNFLSNIKALFNLSLIALILYLPALIKTGLNGSSFGLSTIGNNDVAFYSLTASEFLKTGFVNSQNIANQDLNSTAFFQHQAANLVIALASSIFHLQTWQTLNGVMIFCISIAILGVAYLSKTLFPSKSEKIPFLVGVTVIASPAMTYVIGQVFLGQITSIPISAITLGVFINLGLGKSDTQRIDSLSLAYLFLLSSMVYPVFLIPVYFGCIFLYLILKLFEGHRNFFIQGFRDLRYIPLGMALSIPYLPTAIYLIFLLNSAEAGWSLDSITPASLVISSNLIGYSLPDFLVLLIWILSFCFFYFIISQQSVQLNPRERLLRHILFFGLTGIYVIATQVREGSFSDYHNWKLLTYFFTILYALFLTDLIRVSRLKIVALSPFVLFSFFSPITQWVPSISNGVGVLTRDMSDLRSIEVLQGLPAINVGARPYFDSMVIADILENRKIYISSKTTMPILQNPEACTIVDLRDGQYPEVQLLNQTYGIIPSKDFGCNIRNATDNYLKVNINEKLLFGSTSEGNKALVENWSSPESWGVWSLGNHASIRFRIVEPKAGNHWIEISGFPFLNPNEETTLVTFSSPLFERKSFVFREGSPSRLIKMKLYPNALQNSKGLVEIFIETPGNTSPKRLGISGDPRLLGFGITHIKFLNFETR